MPSIVIPAYNEANGIERCLRALLVDAVDNLVDNLVIVVVANACKDDTAARARAFGNGVIVIETEQGGKTNAVNLGERTLRARGLDLYPRLFLDGDIELLPGSLPAMLAAAQAGESPRIVAARPRFDASRSSLPVRLFYHGEAFNPYHRSGAPNGSGTFMVNAAGRARWDEFPAILADDSFVERRFAPSERATVAGATAIVRVPRTFTALRRISARKRLAATRRRPRIGGNLRGCGARHAAQSAALACICPLGRSKKRRTLRVARGRPQAGHRSMAARHHLSNLTRSDRPPVARNCPRMAQSTRSEPRAQA